MKWGQSQSDAVGWVAHSGIKDEHKSSESKGNDEVLENARCNSFYNEN